MPNIHQGQLDIRAAFNNDYVEQAPPLPVMKKNSKKVTQNAVAYHPIVTQVLETVYDRLATALHRHIRMPSSSYSFKRYNPEEIHDLKGALEAGAITQKHLNLLNRFCAFKDQQTFLYRLVEDNEIDIIKILLAIPGINVNRGNYQGRTPLMLASQKRRLLPIIPLLLAHPEIDVNRLCKPRQPSEMGRFHPAKTALHTAVHCENKNAVDALFKHPSIDISIKDSYGKTAYMYAVENLKDSTEQYAPIIALFEAKGVTPYMPRTSEVRGFGAVKNFIDRMRARDIVTDPNAMIQEDTALVSFLNAHAESINDVIGLSGSIPDHLYRFPKAYNRLETCEGTILVDTILRSNLTAAMALVTHPSTDVRKPVLLNAWNYFSEYTFDIPNVTFPLMCATKDLSFTKLLLSHPDIDVNQKNIVGETSLMRACASADEEVVKELLKQSSIDLNCQNIHGESALYFGSPCPAIVSLLLADKRLETSQVLVACIKCVMIASIPTLQLLLRHFKGTPKETKRLKCRMLKQVYKHGEGKDAVQRAKWLHSLGAFISNNDLIHDSDQSYRFVDHIFQHACVTGDVELTRHFLEEPYFSRYKVDISEKTLFNWRGLGTAGINDVWRDAGFVGKPGSNSLMEKVLLESENKKAIVILLTFGTPNYEKFLRYLRLKAEFDAREEAERMAAEEAERAIRARRNRVHMYIAEYTDDEDEDEDEEEEEMRRPDEGEYVENEEQYVEDDDTSDPPEFEGEYEEDDDEYNEHNGEFAGEDEE